MNAAELTNRAGDPTSQRFDTGAAFAAPIAVR
jgi:hypothetical protein